jgi:two-component system cell cycle sensor histidine kinase/response regulator CckA
MHVIGRTTVPESLAELLDGSPDGVLLVDEAGRVLAWNSSMVAASGLSPELFASTTVDTIDACLAEVERDEAGAVPAIPDFQIARQIVTAPDGRPFERFERRVNLSQGETGRLIWYSPFDLSAAVSESERVQLQTISERRRHALRMEAVGRLAGGIAHDFNNMLTVMIGFAEHLQAEIGEHDSLNQVVRAAQRAADLTRQLLAFSRQQVLRPQVVELSGVVSAMGGMVDRIIGDDIRLCIDAPAGLPSVRADPSQLEQIILNLVINARDAMPHGGRLTIAVRRSVLDAPRPGRGVEPAGEYMQLTVSDTGEGIAPELLSKVFEPFFTTKGVHGTGLGLSTVYGIVKQSGGFNWVDSEPGAGTTFTIDLPVSSTPQETCPPPEGVEQESDDHRGGRILVVEDLEAVRSVTREMLQTEGYDVLEAGTPSEALDIVQSAADPIDLVLSDVMMPEMTGSQLAAAIREKQPGIPVLFMSGLPKALDWNEPDSFLPKPFTRAALLSRVKARMARASFSGVARRNAGRAGKAGRAAG